MVPVPFMSFLPPLPLPPFFSVNLLRRQTLSPSRLCQGGNGLPMQQPNVLLLTSDSQQLLQ